MKNVGDLMKRLQKMMPANVKPASQRVKNFWRGKKNRVRSALPPSPVKTGR